MLQTIRTIPAAVWRVLVHSTLIGLGMSFFDVLFNFFLVSMGYAADTVGVLSTVARIAGLIVGIPAGRLIDRIGSRRALIASVMLYTVGLVAVVFAPNYPLLIASQFVVGCAFALLFSALFPLLTQTTPHAQQTTVFGFNEAALNTIGLVGSIVAGWLPSVVAPWLNVDDQSTLAYRTVLLIGIAIFALSSLPLLGNMPVASNTDSDGVPLQAEVPMRTTWRIPKSILAHPIRLVRRVCRHRVGVQRGSARCWGHCNRPWYRATQLAHMGEHFADSRRPGALVDVSTDVVVGLDWLLFTSVFDWWQYCAQ
jgi:MFS family permease